MLPANFKLEDLDDGIRPLVVNLNRISEINPKTTLYGPTSCEGHVYNGSIMLAKPGWIHFYKEDDKREDLIQRIVGYCDMNPLFNLEILHKMEERDFLQAGFRKEIPTGSFHMYILNGTFEPGRNGPTYLYDWNENKKDDHFRAAKATKKKLLQGWNDLNSIVEEYITSNITSDLSSLPFQSSEESEIFIGNCFCHHF